MCEGSEERKSVNKVVAMENNMLRMMKRHLEEMKRTRDRSIDRLNEIDEYTSWTLKPGNTVNGVTYYNVVKPGSKKRKYLGNQNNETVIRIQEARYLRELIQVADRDIDLMGNFLELYESASFAHINELLPKTYRNNKALRGRDKKRVAAAWKSRKEKEKAEYPVYKPEELKQPTIDGNYVRSKTEAMIYNFLVEHGYTFVYELPLKGKSRLFYPDFTILSEIDYITEVRIEHHGMMSDDGYRQGAEAREYDYWYNGFLPNRDVYFTFDDNRGVLDMAPISEILNSRVRPLGS